MTIKNDISTAYLQTQRQHHSARAIRSPANVFITGDGKSGSIGERIRERLLQQQHIVLSCDWDVRSSWFTDLQPFDVLILCHGVTHLEWFEATDMQAVQSIFDVNVVGSYRLAQRFVQHTLNEPYRKRIIMIGSMAHRMVLNGSAAYCASKAALAMLGRCMAWELAPKGYDVFVIHPSNTAGTPMTEETIQGLMRYRGLSRADAEAYWNDSPIRPAILSTDEIAELVLFLMGPHSSYLSGAPLELAGGQR